MTKPAMTERLRPEDQLELRPLLTRVLRDDGLGALCKTEPRSHIDIGTRISVVFMSAVTLGITFVLSDWFEFGFYAWLALNVVGATALGVLGLRWPTRVAGALALVWLGLAVAQLAERQSEDFVVTVVLPFGLSVSAAWIVRGRRLTSVAKGTPLILPVTLTVVLIPLLTSELWQAAASLEPRHLATLAILAVGPILLAFWRQVRARVPAELMAALERVADDPLAPQRALERLVRVAGEGQERDRLRERFGPELNALFRTGIGTEQREAVRDALTAPLRRQVTSRLLSTAVGLGLVVAVYLYGLAWIVVPVQVAQDWTGSVVRMVTLETPAGEVHAPYGPFVAVALILGALATAVLLAFVLTDEGYAGGLTRALLREPVEAGMEFALPYAALRQGEAVTPLEAMKQSGGEGTAARV